MIQQKLLDFKYYYNKLPLYLRNSQSFPEHFRIWCEFLNNINDISDELLGLVNIFDTYYLQKYSEVCDDFLDKLGALYGVSRNFSVVVDEEQGGIIEKVVKYVSLSQLEFLILIKSQIIKNFFQGTVQEIVQFYKDANLPIFMQTLRSATCAVYLILGQVDGIDSNATNVINMFKSGLLTIESAGINYLYDVYNDATVLKWDDGNKVWDSGEWTI